MKFAMISFASAAATASAESSWYFGEVRGESCNQVCETQAPGSTCNARRRNMISTVDEFKNAIHASEQAHGTDWGCRAWYPNDNGPGTPYPKLPYCPGQSEGSGTCYVNTKASHDDNQAGTCEGTWNTFTMFCCCLGPDQDPASACAIGPSDCTGSTSWDDAKQACMEPVPETIDDALTWNKGKCYVDDTGYGPQMKDNIDLFGLDWIKYWSPNAEHNNGNLDSPKTASAAACCEACESTPGCNMWTWTKTQQGCYLKNASEDTTYVERFDEGRVSGGWDSSVHKDTNTFFDGDATSTTVQHAAFNTNGVMVGHENAGEIHTAATTEDVVDHDVDHFHRRLDVAHYLQGIDYPSEDFVKFSNGRPEARTPASCEEACTANEKCEYWSWSHNDPQASCYLKSNFAMADQSFGYGYPVRSANAHRSLRPAATLISPPHPTRIFFFFFFFFCAHNRPTPSASCRASCAAAPTALAPRGRSSFRRPSFARTLSSSP